MDTSGWERRLLDLRTGICLDSHNVRLETANPKVEADIMEDLFANEHALQLVEQICALGFLTHETPVGVKRGSDVVVVEGNRRVAALKAMQNPLLVPDYSNRVKALLEKYPDYQRVSEIEVLLAPSQDDADQLIAAIHTGNQRRPWTPTRQAAFFQAQIDAGRSYEELLSRYPTSNVPRFVLRARVVNLLKEADYQSPELQDYVVSRGFRRGLSTLARILESKEFQNLTGLGLAKDGTLVMSISASQFAAIGSVIMDGMCEGSLNTRTLNKVRNNPRFAQLMNDIRRVLAPPREPHEAKGGTVLSKGVAEPEPKVVSTTSKHPRRTQDKYLNVSRLNIPEYYGEGFKQTIEELSVTDVTSHPATAFLLMRAALEKGIKSFAEARKEDIRGSGNNDNGFVYLSHCMNWLSDAASATGDRWVKQVVSNMNKLVYYGISKDKLNAVNHNHKMYVTTEEAIDMWRSVVSLLEYVVQP